MAFTEFYMDNSAGSNLNAGSTAGAAVYTSTAGNWDGTSIFTPTDGQTTTSLVSAGDWASIYPTGNSTTPYVAQVTAVGAGVNGTITLSTTAKFGTAPTSNSGSRNCKTGGAWADLGMVASGVALNTGTVTQSTRINVKAGTYANATVGRTLALAGTTTTPLWWRGYRTTIGDQDGNNTAVAGTDIPSWTWTTGTLITSGAHQSFSSIDFTGAQVSASTGQVNISGTAIQFQGCRFTCTAANANSLAARVTGTTIAFTRCYFTSNAAANIVNTTTGNHVFTVCRFTGGAIGLNLAASATMVVDGCIFDSQGSDQIAFTTGTGVISNCSFYKPTGNCISITGTPGAMLTIRNSYFSTANQPGKAAINNSSGTASNLLRVIGNAYFNCTNYILGQGDTPLVYDVGNLGAEAFTTPDSQDFSLKPFAKGLGFPGKFENTSVYVGHISNGAVQPPPGSGGIDSLVGGGLVL